MKESVIDVLGRRPTDHAMKEKFMSWQCRVRQIAMRENEGRPDDSFTPFVTLEGSAEPMGQIITVMSKWGAYSKTAELKHMVKQTHDPAQRREKALRFFSEYYYQKPREFSDTLTATFLPLSEGAQAILAAPSCSLRFEAFGQRFDISCKAIALSESNPLYQSTWWHNQLFNPAMNPDTQVVGFEANWDASTATSLVS